MKTRWRWFVVALVGCGGCSGGMSEAPGSMGRVRDTFDAGTGGGRTDAEGSSGENASAGANAVGRAGNEGGGAFEMPLFLEPLVIDETELFPDASETDVLSSQIVAVAGPQDDLVAYGAAGRLVDGGATAVESVVFSLSVQRGTLAVLDEATPWKRLIAWGSHFLVGERGTGPASAAPFVWEPEEGVRLLEPSHELSVAGADRTGAHFVGRSQSVGEEPYGVLWTEGGSGESIELRPPSGYSSSDAVASSADGQVVFGYLVSGDDNAEPFRWTRETGVTPLGRLDSFDGWQVETCWLEAPIADDGTRIAGTCTFADPSQPTASGRWRAFQWSEAEGLTDLGEGNGEVNSLATGVSRDGSAVFGRLRSPDGSEEPFRWTAEDGFQSLGLAQGVGNAEWVRHVTGEWRAVSYDGTVAVGNATDPERIGFLWSLERGTIPLQPLPGHTWSRTTGIERNGEVITGLSWGESEIEVVVWNREGVPFALRDLVGMKFPDGFRLAADSTSAVATPWHYGLLVFGQGITPDGSRRAWLAPFPGLPVRLR